MKLMKINDFYIFVDSYENRYQEKSISNIIQLITESKVVHLDQIAYLLNEKIERKIIYGEFITEADLKLWQKYINFLS